MVSAFEWAIVALLFFGLVLPIWIFFFAGFLSRRMRSGKEPSSRYFAYARLLEYLHDELSTGTVELGPLWMATLRELCKYPEYRDISLLYLEEVKITGSNKFDLLMEKELKDTESFLLENEK